MNGCWVRRRSLRVWAKTMTAVIVISLLLPLGPHRLPTWLGEAGVEPQLLELAQTYPNTSFRVIVQKYGGSDQAEQLVEQLGGEILAQLPMINAFVAKIPGSQITKLRRRGRSIHWVSLDSATISADESNEVKFKTWATDIGAAVATTFTDASNMVDEAGLGPDGMYGYGGRAQAAFTGFEAEITPGYAIDKVEVRLYAYVPAPLPPGNDPIVRLYVGGQQIGAAIISHSAFDGVVGVSAAHDVKLNVTSLRSWTWGDFDSGIEIVIDQSQFQDPTKGVYYDAIGLKVESKPGADNSGHGLPTASPAQAFDTSHIASAYQASVRAPDVWNEGPGYLQGQGVTVAVVDSGINKGKDKQVVKHVNFNTSYHDAKDRYGHGTFVAALVGSNGKKDDRRYPGIAPHTNLLNLRVSDDQGMATEAEVISALQWVLNNKAAYNIRVVNLSLNAAVTQSYHTSPLDAAVEILWFNGITVVVSAGNNGTAALYPPANDPFVITVGATDDKGTPSIADDTIANFSAFGLSEAGLPKPELVAPGKNIVTYLHHADKLNIGQAHPANIVDKDHFRMSGTSMAAPMVAGAVALLLQDEPNLTPDQVKFRLMATANKNWGGYDANRAGAGYLDVYAAIHGASTESANTGIQASQLLWTGSNPITWGSVNWNSVNWNSVNWNSVNWNSVNWNSVNWNSDYWGP